MNCVLQQQNSFIGINSSSSDFDERQQFYESVDFYQLDLEMIQKNKELQQIMAEHPEQKPFALNEEKQVVRLSRDRKYFGDEFMFLPKRLLRRRGYRVTPTEIEQLAADTRAMAGANYLWENDIPGVFPTLELTTNAHISLATHDVLPNEERMARSAINNDPFNRVDVEEFYKPTANCNKWDCEIHRPFLTFLEAWWAEKKMSPRDVLIGSQIDSRDAKLVDFILYTKPVLELMREGIEVLF